jgi:adenylate kinase
VLQKRLDGYKEKVVPVIEWYRGKGLLIEIDGTQEADMVYQGIIDKLAARADSAN